MNSTHIDHKEAIDKHLHWRVTIVQHLSSMNDPDAILIPVKSPAAQQDTSPAYYFSNYDSVAKHGTPEWLIDPPSPHPVH